MMCTPLNSNEMSVRLWWFGLNATFNNISDISWRSVLLVEETGEPGEKPNELSVIGIKQNKIKQMRLYYLSMLQNIYTYIIYQNC